jgi:hypothetical protein
MPSYCERGGPGLLAEPFNTFSNIAFIIAAVAGWQLARRHGGPSAGVALLLWLAVAIGAGSTLLHMLPRPWARVADMAPIVAFQIVFLWLYLRSELSLGRTLFLLAGFSMATLATGWLPAVLNGSLFYLPALLVLSGLGVRAWRRDRQCPLLVASGLLVAGLVFRTLDPWACGIFPHGSHFLWHLLNGGVIYQSLAALVSKTAAD